MAINQEGDVLLCQSNDEGDIEVKDGITTMTKGFETAFYLSVAGGNENDNGTTETQAFAYWGNLLENDPAFKYVSRTQFLLKSIPAISGNLPKITEAVELDVKWLLDSGAATKIEVSTIIPALNKIEISAKIEAQGQIINIKFVENWKGMQ